MKTRQIVDHNVFKRRERSLIPAIVTSVSQVEPDMPRELFSSAWILFSLSETRFSKEIKLLLMLLTSLMTVSIFEETETCPDNWAKTRFNG